MARLRMGMHMYAFGEQDHFLDEWPQIARYFMECSIWLDSRVDEDRSGFGERHSICGLKLHLHAVPWRDAMRAHLILKDRTVFMDFRTDPTENVFPMVQAGKGITEMLLGAEDL